ncbi:MAG: hypothetical protein RL154_107 [Pseudomonadota bacterium]|jgi:hypothetical protein
MTLNQITKKQFLIFKWSVYTLLATNVFLYFMEAKITESIDTFSWVIIIGLYEWETTSLDKAYANRLEMYAITFFRVIAYGVLMYCAYDYFLEDKWLDFANSCTWFVVCATLEYDVYFPGDYNSNEWKIRNYIKITLYTLLFSYMLIWLFSGRALDFYDAFLWLLAFIVIELNIFGFEQKALDLAAKKQKKPPHH